MRYPNFAQALKERGSIEEAMRLLDCGRTQAIQYREGRTLPKAEKLLRHPELLDAARRDVQTPSPQVLIAA